MHPGLQTQSLGRAKSTYRSCTIANAKTCANARQQMARLRALVPLGRAALLPMRSALRKVWAAYRVQAIPDEPAASYLCLASYWSKMSMEEREALQATITAVWPRCRFTFQMWGFHRRSVIWCPVCRSGQNIPRRHCRPGGTSQEV